MTYFIKNIFIGITYAIGTSVSFILLSTTSLPIIKEKESITIENLIKKRIIYPSIFGAILGFSFGFNKKYLINIVINKFQNIKYHFI